VFQLSNLLLGNVQAWVSLVLRVIPLLTDAQHLKHFTFAKHFRNNWGLGAGKYLLIEYDEKWFWGLVMRRGAKSCEDLGINPQSYSAYHKSHIAKTMGVAFTAFAFEDSIENGGDAIKLGFFRAQSFKVAQKMVKESVRQPDGSVKHNVWKIFSRLQRGTLCKGQNNRIMQFFK
jgi:hypothetical protein